MYFLKLRLMIEDARPVKGMKIAKVTEEEILFSNGNRIEFDHSPDGYEYNYADFKAIEDTVAMDNFYPEDLKFEQSSYGFRFGSDSTGWVFVPCYSAQSGYYSYDVDIYYNDVLVLTAECEDADF